MKIAMNPIIVLCTLLCTLALAACGKSSSGDTRSNNQASSASSSSSSSSSSSGVPYSYLGSVQKNLAITSAITGVTYPYHVYLPYNYAISAKTYPIIYCTDAQWVFNHFSQILDARNKEVIFVGIEEGALNSNRRFADFMGPGVNDYMRFFKTEFAALMESRYRTNQERTFIGTSLGGLLGSTFMTREPIGEPYFKNYMLFDGSFFAIDAAGINDELSRYNASKQLNITLILTSANPGNEESVNGLQERYRARAYEGLTIYRRSFAVPHDDVANPSFEATIDLLY
jgi:predicted alpha/beta superfamily hydrolase